ncbi:MAG: DNA polymerase III subunit epsilon [Rhodoferax sp.]|nr:DNA polymerase III subunit epsilon [Rhodoferax sp.]
MKPRTRGILVMLAPGAVLGLAVLLIGVLAWLGLGAEQQAVLVQASGSLIPMSIMGWLIASAALAMPAQRLFQDHVQALAQLEEQTRILVSGQSRQPIEGSGSAEVRALARAINDLAAERHRLQDDVALQVHQASQGIERERRRLAALMAELQQSVVVCNLDGRILLYNNRARLQYQALADNSALADGAGTIGLGRSIHAVFDASLVAHALDTIRRRLDRGATNASAQFVTTTRSGQLLRAQVAAVLDQPDDAPPSQTPQGGGKAKLSGFVLLLDNLTRDFEQQSLRDQLLHTMTEGSRSALANLQTALDMLDFPDLEPEMRTRFLGVVREEAAAMSERVQTLAQQAATSLKTRWPMEDMRASDLVAAIARRMQAVPDLQVGHDATDASLWLRVDSFSLMQALAYLASRLAQEFGIKQATLRMSRSGNHAHLDLVWHGTVMSTETVMAWELDSIRVGDTATPLTVRDVVERHGGAFWFERERARHEALFRFLLPLAGAAASEAPEQADAAAPTRQSRPAFYDFDLFQPSDMARALQDRRLDSLSYTVFDTETTGLDPSQGDEIIQIGATRIVNGKLLHHEGFEQLVDPQRAIPSLSTGIHGITSAMVRGQPGIAQVLRSFHAYTHDTILVAHNAAFDMRFLQLKEGDSGVVFTQPVLDTLLLSDVAHPHQTSHALEAIAQRLGVPMAGRHTALADAVVTAEVFIKLIPLLADKGIHTLGQAREAAQQSRFASVKY